MAVIDTAHYPIKATRAAWQAPLTPLNRPQCLIEPLNEILSREIAIALVQMLCQVPAYLLMRERGIGPLVFVRRGWVQLASPRCPFGPRRPASIKTKSPRLALPGAF